MKKFIIFLVVLYPCIMFAGLAWVYVYDINVLHKTMIEMDASLNAANNYCVKQSQDITGLQDILKDNRVSGEEYQHWLTAMERMDSVTFNHDGTAVQSTVTGASVDEIFKERFLKKLIEEKDSHKGEIMTPLNFGITYLDRQRLEQEARWYMHKRVLDFNDRFAFGKMGLYRIDPNTLDVRVSLKVTPINLVDLNVSAFVKSQYLKLFGTDTQKGGDVSAGGRVMSNVIVKYDIDYYLYYDYISSSPFLRIAKSDLAKFVRPDQLTPPADIYFPFWYTKDGLINPDEKKRLASPIRKLKLSEPIKYSYSFVLTN